MSTTIRIKADQAKAGDVRVFGTGAKRTVTEVITAHRATTLIYGDKGMTWHQEGSSSLILIELPETHPIAVLERMQRRVLEQRRANHLELLEAVRTEDKEATRRRREDDKLLRGKDWGLQQAIQELRAGIEYFGKTN
jgi:hypothetical protein